jgi:hypothetical protein
MRALKLNGRISHDHTLRVSVPPEVPEGPAEVIVLLPEDPRQPDGTLRAFLDGVARRPRKVRSKEDIDRALASERASWG